MCFPDLVEGHVEYARRRNGVQILAAMEGRQHRLVIGHHRRNPQLDLRKIGFDQHLPVVGANTGTIGDTARDILHIRANAGHAARRRAELDIVGVNASCVRMHVSGKPLSAEGLGANDGVAIFQQRVRKRILERGQRSRMRRVEAMATRPQDVQHLGWALPIDGGQCLQQQRRSGVLLADEGVALLFKHAHPCFICLGTSQPAVGINR